MAKLKNTKYEIFAQAVAKGMSQKDAAIKAGYSPKTAIQRGSQLFTMLNIQCRINELLEKAADNTIMSVIERKRKLTELGRGNLGDYLVCPPDGHPTIAFDDDTPNKGAVAGLEQTIVISKDDIEVRNRKIKLHDPVKAIAELNKMDGAYPKQELDINLHNVQVIMPDNKRKK